MAIYSITYDLIKDKDYDKVSEGIKKISGSWARPTKTQWLIETDKSLTQIWEQLKKYADNDDIFFIVKVNMPEWLSINIPKDVIEWLNARRNS